MPQHRELSYFCSVRGDRPWGHLLLLTLVALPGTRFLLLTLESYGVALGRLLGVLLLYRSKVHGSKLKV